MISYGSDIKRVGFANDREVRDRNRTPATEQELSHADRIVVVTKFKKTLLQGLAYVWDPAGRGGIGDKCHPQFVETLPLTDCDCREQALVHQLVQWHFDKTNSRA
jgi:hypothetical protein